MKDKYTIAFALIWASLIMMWVFFFTYTLNECPTTQIAFYISVIISLICDAFALIIVSKDM